MAKVSIYRHKRDGMLHLRFTNAGTHASRALSIKVSDSQWDGKKVINHPNAQEMNLALTAILTKAQMELLNVVNTMPTRFAHPSVIRDKVCDVVFPAGEVVAPVRKFIDIMSEFRDAHDKKSTRMVYSTTIGILERYARQSMADGSRTSEHGSPVVAIRPTIEPSKNGTSALRSTMPSTTSTRRTIRSASGRLRSATQGQETSLPKNSVASMPLAPGTRTSSLSSSFSWESISSTCTT